MRLAAAAIPRCRHHSQICHQKQCTNRSKRAEFTSHETAVSVHWVAKSTVELEDMMEIMADHFQSFALQVAESKTLTMTWTTLLDIRKSTTVMKENKAPLQNVRKFRYVLFDDPEDPETSNTRSDQHPNLSVP